jgi:site-specific DNA-methyltransferase (adenine-specific)/site-specific DNA-methyltransferase (cytosine-N4-specific)
LEDTPDEWVARLVAVFREVKRVLRDDGTLWVEIGDSYAGAGYSNHENTGGVSRENGGSQRHRSGTGHKPKDLLGQPWMLAFALRADGWYLRSEIIWARPNPMPESVQDRPTKSHSTVFLLSKQARYFYDADAISERERWPNPSGANARSVWTIPTEPTPFAHFATWPRKLVARMILAGTSERGVCPECGAPWVRETEETLGWSPSCDCMPMTAAPNSRVLVCDDPVPATVLDPFAGSGTTLIVARSLGRRSIGVELNEEYCRLVRDRTMQQSLLAV